MAKKPVKYYVVDAFTDSAFKGNPAAVCLLEEDKDDKWLQSVAAEFNISETCYLTTIHGTSIPRFDLRWFTPVAEVDLCGHATLAAAHTLFSSGLVDKNAIEFVTRSGILTAKRTDVTSAPNLLNGEASVGFYIELDFPADPIAEFNSNDTSLISGALNGASIIDIKRTTNGDNLLVDLCGHATLAAAHTLFSSGLVDKNAIEFVTRSGILTAKRTDVTSAPNLLNGEASVGFYIELDFPADPIAEFNSNDTSLISGALNGASIIDIKRTTNGDNLLVVVTSGENVTKVQPQFDAIVKCPGMGIIVTGIAPPGSGFDFYSRYFCPKHGINEDPVCGSAHCGLAPYWSKKLGKCDLKAYQASARGGILNIHIDEQKQRVFLRGKAVTVMEGCVLV